MSADATPARSPWLATAEDAEWQLQASLFLANSISTDKFTYIRNSDVAIITMIVKLDNIDHLYHLVGRATPGIEYHKLQYLGGSLQPCSGDDFKLGLRHYGGDLLWKISIEARDGFRAVMQTPAGQFMAMMGFKKIKYQMDMANTITQTRGSSMRQQATKEWEAAEAGKREAWITARITRLEAEKIAETAQAEEEADRQLVAEVEARIRRRQAAALLLAKGEGEPSTTSD